MPFQIPENIHPNCARLAWLIGTWAGNGHGQYPTIEPFQFGQEVIFQQDGRPFIHYFSRAWITDAEGNTIRPAAQATGRQVVRSGIVDRRVTRPTSGEPSSRKPLLKLAQ